MQARDWLSQCRRNHVVFSRNVGHDLPTRLIKIQNDNDELYARVCDASELENSTDYFTLSHCWGKSRFLTLRTCNYTLFHESLPWPEMPRLFQDAIKLTFELGFQYIWIDCLCIVQDSEFGADWLKECKRMDQYHGNAVCNLPATGFSDGQNGMFPTSAAQDILPRKFEVHSSKSKTSKIWSKSRTSKLWYAIGTAEQLCNEIKISTLYRRAWVCQEQVMVSPVHPHFHEVDKLSTRLGESSISQER